MCNNIAGRESAFAFLAAALLTILQCASPLQYYYYLCSVHARIPCRGPATHSTLTLALTAGVSGTSIGVPRTSSITSPTIPKHGAHLLSGRMHQSNDLIHSSHTRCPALAHPAVTHTAYPAPQRNSPTTRTHNIDSCLRDAVHQGITILTILHPAHHMHKYYTSSATLVQHASPPPPPVSE